MIFKEDGQEYAQVLRMLGNGRLEAQCIDGTKRLCHIRGKMRKKVWVNQGDIILVGLRDYQDAKGDVILKYMADEARSLKQYGELPENIRVNDTDAMMEGEENENAECVPAWAAAAAAWHRSCSAAAARPGMCMLHYMHSALAGVDFLCGLAVVMTACCAVPCYCLYCHAIASVESTLASLALYLLCMCLVCRFFDFDDIAEI